MFEGWGMRDVWIFVVHARKTPVYVEILSSMDNCTCIFFKRFFLKFCMSANKCHVCLPNQRDLARDVCLWPFHWFDCCLQNNMMNKFYLFGCYECSSFQFLDQNLWYHKQRIAPQSQPINHIRNSVLFILRVYIR